MPQPYTEQVPIRDIYRCKKKPELKKVAKALKLKRYSKLNKPDLVDKIVKERVNRIDKKQDEIMKNLKR